MPNELKAPDDLAGELATWDHYAEEHVTNNPALIAENERLLCEINALKDALAQANGGSDD